MKLFFSAALIAVLCCSSAPAWELRDLVAPTGYAKDRDLGPSWAAHGGTVHLEFNLDLLADLGLSVDAPGAESPELGRFVWQIQPSSAIEFKVRAGVTVERLTAGRWVTQGGLRLFHGPRVFDLANVVMQPTPNAPHVLEVYASSGELLFFIDHMHVLVDPDAERIEMKNMDFRLSPWLAAEIGEARHAGMAIAMMVIDSPVHIPAGAHLGPEESLVEGTPSCANRPLWPTVAGTVADVSLIAMSQIQQMRRNATTGEVVIAPSATLKNRLGADTADIPWRAQFSGTFPPYGNAQHPFLAWGMFRVADGKIEQIGRSGAKHAFLTINVNCQVNCNSGQVLWPGCEDVYGTGNNDSSTYMGPIDEIQAFAGTWNPCGSFFDPNCGGSQTQSSTGGYINRMVVQDQDMQVAGAQYLFQSWYVVRDDINIFNTMGYRPINPVFGGSSWSFGASAMTVGPAVDAVIAPGSNVGNRRNERFDTAAGKGSLLVDVVSLPGGQYRYEYAVMNFDLDQGLDRFSVPLQPGTSVHSTQFRRPPNSGSGDWTVQVLADQVTWTAPSEAAKQPWISLFNFTLVTTAPPQPGMPTVRVFDGAGNGRDLGVSSLVPSGSEIIFQHDFEN